MTTTYETLMEYLSDFGDSVASSQMSAEQATGIAVGRVIRELSPEQLNVLSQRLAHRVALKVLADDIDMARSFTSHHPL